MRRSAPIVLVTCAIAVLGTALAGCGGDDDAPVADPGPATTAPPTAPATTAPPTRDSALVVDADPSGALAFVQTTLSTSAGEVTITLRNDSPVPHNVAVRGGSVATEPSLTISGGETADLTVDLPAGEYEFYCEVPGHAEAGMVGTLTAG